MDPRSFDRLESCQRNKHHGPERQCTHQWIIHTQSVLHHDFEPRLTSCDRSTPEAMICVVLSLTRKRGRDLFVPSAGSSQLLSGSELSNSKSPTCGSDSPTHQSQAPQPHKCARARCDR